MRMAKIKSSRDVVMTLQHNTRERMPPNADPDLTDENFNYGGSTLETMNRFHALLPDKVRSNAVHAVEIVMTASPDFGGDWGRYLQACDGWAKSLFGEKNLLHINHHYDESTPHTHILFMPLKDQKLNAKHFIGGSQDRMAELQEDFFQKVGQLHGLERGQPRAETRARHTPHTLSAKAAELDERETSLAERSAKLDEREKKLNAFADEYQSVMGVTPADIRELKNKVSRWYDQTPDSLRNFALMVEVKGCRTVAEYHQLGEARREREQQQKHRFTR